MAQAMGRVLDGIKPELHFESQASASIHPASHDGILQGFLASGFP